MNVGHQTSTCASALTSPYFAASAAFSSATVVDVSDTGALNASGGATSVVYITYAVQPRSLMFCTASPISGSSHCGSMSLSSVCFGSAVEMTTGAEISSPPASATPVTAPSFTRMRVTRASGPGRTLTGASVAAPTATWNALD